eukprot:12910843-Prorocentrum_lima.AAC.1
MRSFNQGPGRNPGIGPTKKVDITYLDGKPLLMAEAEKGNSEQVNLEDAWKGYQAGKQEPTAQ